MITKLQMLRLAHAEALRLWATEKDFLEEHPDNSISIYQEKKKWNQQEELGKMLFEEEKRLGII